MFQRHLALLKTEFCFEKFIGLENEWVKILALLDEGRLDVSVFFFKITMKSNHFTTLEPPLPCNPIIRLWSKITSNTFLHHQLLEYFALAKVVVVMVLGSMENECYFSTLFFMKSKLWNQLTTHLNLVVNMFAHIHYTLDTFPFGDVIKDWID
jgi:hypothetical protein